MRESIIEAHLVRAVKAAGGTAYKFKSPGRVSVPDRLVLMAGMEKARARFRLSTVEEIQELLSYFIVFVELKATGETASEAQLREHARLREMGFKVNVIDSKQDVDTFIRE
jgi:hypothetical protein